MSDRSRPTTRRGLIAAAATSFAAATGTALAAPQRLELKNLKKEGDVACLYHCDFGEQPRFLQMLQNISNHYSVYGADPFALQLAIVAHGPGVKFFLSDLEGTPWSGDAGAAKVFERLEDVARNGLKIYLCEITFSRLKIDKAKARAAGFIQFVPSGVAAVGALQAKGFGYMKVG